MDEKAMLALALAVAKRVNDLATDDNDVFICVHPDPQHCPEDEDGLWSCGRCLAEYLLPVIREELEVTK